MQVLKIRAGQETQIGELDNTLEAMQRFVGGYIEIVRLSDDLALVCNEEGKLQGLPMSAWLCKRGALSQPYDVVCGDCFLCRVDGEDFAGLQYGDVAEAMLYVQPMEKTAPNGNSEAVK